MSESLGVCVVGIGSVAIYHLQAIKKIDGIHLSAVVSRSSKKGEQTAINYGAKNHYQTLKDAISDPDIDAIILCTPTQNHFHETLLSIQHGKHVLLEKPITDTYDQARRLALERLDNKVLVMAGQISRFLEPYARCKDIINDGGIGRPLQGIERRLMHRKEFPSWFPGGKGHLINHWGCHPIDLFQWWFSSPAVCVYCHATSNIPMAGGEDDVVLCIELENNAVGCFHHSYHSRRFETSMILIGDRGTLEVIWEGSPGSKGKNKGLSIPTNEDQARVFLYHNEELIYEDGVERASDDAFVVQLNEFISAIQGSRPPCPSVEDTVVTMAVVDAARRASLEHRVVNVAEILAHKT